MPQNFVGCDREQAFLLPPDVRDWLPERHLAQDALAELFGGVLELCAEAGLVRVGVVAVDGTKVHANASRDQTMGYEQIAR